MNTLPDRAYELLGQMTQGTPSQGLPTDDVISSTQATQELTTAYITTLYYSALTNLYLQSTLPATLEEVDAERPRLRVAFERSYADFTASLSWLNKNGSEFIATSTAKHYYDEVSGMEENSITDIVSFYTRHEA